MHNNILQQIGGYSFLSPSYIRNQYIYNLLDQSGYKRSECPDEDGLVPESSLNTSPVSSGYGSFVETPGTSSNESLSNDAGDHNRLSPYDYISGTYGKVQTRVNVQKRSEVETPGTSSNESQSNDAGDHNRLSPYDYISGTYGKVQTCVNVQKRSEEETPSEHNIRHEELDPSSPDTFTCRPGSSSSQSSESYSPSGTTNSSTSLATGTAPPSDTKPPKKNARTAYTNEQTQKLLKIFHENPYPDSEYMERIALELGVAENKIKIWFQNKRARWRRRVNNNNNAAAYHQQLVPPMSPMLSPVSQYGYVPHGQFMTSSPLMLPGYFNYATMQVPRNVNLQGIKPPGQNFKTQPTHPETPPPSQFPSMTPHHLTSSLPHSRSSPPFPSSAICNYNGLFAHYTSPS